jgi:GR25 family glycosyltransferase involved in LPS biosynthesis
MKNFIICLSKIESSISTATDLKHQLENYGHSAELFEGTYGNDAIILMEEEKRSIHPWGIKGPEVSVLADPRITAKFSRPGVKGCFYSHYNLWKKCIEINQPIIIWEDDIVLSRPFIEVEWEDVLVVALGHPTKSGKYIDYLINPPKIPKAVAYKNVSMPGCCGYAIKPHAAKKLVETYKTTYLPADNAINKYHVQIEIHNHIMGRALVEEDGKESLTRSKRWVKLDL